jgi:hypothetical protein
MVRFTVCSRMISNTVSQCVQFATLTGKYLTTLNIQVVVSFETSVIPKCVSPKTTTCILLVSRGNLKRFIWSSCEKNSFVCQVVSVLLSTFVRPGNGLTVWNTRMSGLYTHGDIVWLADFRKRSLWKYKYNEDKKHNRKIDGEGQTWHGKRMDKDVAANETEIWWFSFQQTKEKMQNKVNVTPSLYN